ncbi:hypothetical protein BU25DRAFT_208637 [Macroventuria anomochaeta]|uniref:Uncharacterized protein n=1 Tax=Macroventuria anomochaeta TaxID=301207 RepID=A0ACB6RL91_9PLEO|nr:uncharacterized protein BU25DRAFT_208637 [Macroventuria anomochaeta]KAF2622676.1 hypothetical protein BU25DRAFT_208637 [Macroventuria anomochaeta]
MYRLVLEIAPHHRPVQQPKAFVAIEKLTEADQRRCLKSKLEIRTRESPRQPRRGGTRADPLRPAVRGWPVVARVSPLAHMLIVKSRAESRSFFQQSACDSKLYHVPLYLTPTVSRVRCRDRMYTCIPWRFRLAHRNTHRNINSGLGGKSFVGFEMPNLGLDAFLRTFFRSACISGIPWKIATVSPEILVRMLQRRRRERAKYASTDSMHTQAYNSVLSINCQASLEISGQCRLIWALHPCFAMQVRCKWLDRPAASGKHLDHQFPRQQALWGSRCPQSPVGPASAYRI